jgi:NADPH-dependent 2,4-dienoyl-CoA reductase/sulfur reductase-like enzyme
MRRIRAPSLRVLSRVMLASPPRVAILGAGPVGLEAALAAAAAGWPFTVFEAGDEVGVHVRAWGHVRLFTPWAMNVSDRMRQALGDRAPEGSALPTGHELAERLLAPLAALPAIAPRVRTGVRVLAVGREGALKHELIGAPERGERPFRLLVRDADACERVEHADLVIDATGTYGTPNAMGDGGIPAPGEGTFADRIERRLPDLDADGARWAGRTILLTGAGHSAQTAARALARLAATAPGTRVVWAVRSPRPDWSAVEGDPLPERRALTAAARELAGGASEHVEVRAGRVTDALRGAEGGRVAVTLRNGAGEEVAADRVLALNGGVGDHGLYRQLQVHECYATSGPMKLAAALLGERGGDCLTTASHGAETLTNPEPGFFILGAKSYGRNSRFLLRVGFEQVADVFALAAARR